MEILARAFSALGPSGLIVSDGLSFLVDRLVHGDRPERFIRISDPDNDHGDVAIADYLLDDLQEGCAQLAVARAEDQCSADPRILDAAVDHASRVCREICRLA